MNSNVWPTKHSNNRSFAPIYQIIKSYAKEQRQSFLCRDTLLWGCRLISVMYICAIIKMQKLGLHSKEMSVTPNAGLLSNLIQINKKQIQQLCIC